MADHHSKEQLEPEVAQHLTESMDKVPGPEIKRPAPPSPTDGHPWPDGSRKHHHPKDRDSVHAQQGQQVADAAMHRQSRPQIPHHD